MTNRLPHKLLPSLLAASLAVAGTSAAHAADEGAADGRSICDAIGPAELASLSGLPFDEPQQMPGGRCLFRADDPESGWPVNVALYWDVVVSPETIGGLDGDVDVEVGGARGVFTDAGDRDFLRLALPQGVLTIETWFDLEKAGLDARDLTVSLAEILGDELESLPPPRDPFPGRAELCAALAPAELEELAGPAFGYPRDLGSASCDYQGPGGWLTIGYSDPLPAGDGVQAVVGEQRAVFDTEALYVDLGPARSQTLRVALPMFDAERSGVDREDFLLAVADAIIADLEGVEPSTVTADTGRTSTSLAAPGFLDLDAVRFEGSGEAVRSNPPAMVDAYTSMLDALGADIGQLSVYQADSGGRATEPGYRAYWAVRVAGADGAEIEPAFLEAFGLADPPPESGIEAGEAEIDGTVVTRFTSPDLVDSALYVHLAGDTIYVLQMSADDAARVLETLR